MIQFQENSRDFKVNLFSDFILSKIGLDSTTSIQVADCENFFVIKGITNSKIILDLNNLKNEFVELYPNLFEKNKTFNTIDLINYEKEIDIPNLKSFNLQYRELYIQKI